MMKALRNGFFVLLSLLPALAGAAENPREVVQKTIDQLLADLQQNREQYQSSPAKLYDALDTILGPKVDFDGFARGVMTVRYSRAATPEQMQRFQENFKRSLVKFYGNALLEYENQQIRLLPETASREPNRAVVNMEITGRSGAVYPLSYTMELKGDEWKVRNVIINGINIGKLFRDQFADAMKRNGNDLDNVIATWSDSVAKAQADVEKEAP